MSYIGVPTVTIESAVLASYPELCVRGFRVDVIDAELAGALSGAMSDPSAVLATRGVSVERLADDPLIDGWRKAFQRAGLKPSTFKSSPEALSRRILKGGQISTPLPMVDLYCAVSARSLAPLGAYDLERFTGPADITLRFARPTTDRFTPIGGRPQDFPLLETVPVYAVDGEVICWAFNCRDSVATCLTKGSRALLFLGEAVTLEQREALEAGMEELYRLLDVPGHLCGPIRAASREEPVGSFPAREPWPV
jgi:DNA/RNA-binding domain of Phe-tRNA-synthetase-like protein